MKKEIIDTQRRRATRLIAASAAALPLVTLLRPAQAETLPHVTADDPTAQALKYVDDATTADRPDKMGVPGTGQHCENCQFLQGTAGEEWRPCMLFPGKAVHAKGWCTSWTKKA